MVAIGIDIGGTSIKGAAVTTEGKVLDVFSLVVDKKDNQDQTIDKLIKIVKEYLAAHAYNKDNVLGIGIGIPGSIDSVNGVVSYSNNLKWENLKIVEKMEKELGIRVKITNDANAATLGEAKFGAGKDFKNLLMVTLGTGVGGGIIIDGKLYEGNEGKGAEIGHSVIVLDGRECTCGRRGCLEAYASATGLIYDTKLAMDANKDSLMWEIAEKNGKVDGRVAFEAMRKGDIAGTAVVNQYIKYLGEGLMNFFNIFRPDAVILSGGIANEGEFLLKLLDKYCRDRNFGYNCTPEVKILISKLGYDSGKIGAAALFF